MKPVGFDNTILSILLNPTARIPLDLGTGQPVLMAKRRADYLVDMLGKSRQKIIVPSPAVAELLTAIGPNAQQYIDIISRSRLFEIAPFDSRCAIELACLNREVFSTLDPKNPKEAYQKIKIDRQIIAIFRVAGVENIYTDDDGLAKRARFCGMTPILTAQLALPTEDRQMDINFEAHDDIPEPEGNEFPEAADETEV